ncbi:MAG: DUF2877 domain-containing protein [Treponema sp.]|nr:DUF2877 domain-containing protein [Treponema sp.]
MEKNAVSVGKKWLPYRESGAGGFFAVHSAFNRVINISTGAGLLSVAAEGIGGSSAFLTVQGGRVDCGVPAGGRCFIQAGKMRLADHTINFKNAPLWKGPVTKGYRYSGIKRENIAAFKAVLDRKAAPQSAWRYMNCDSPEGLRNRWPGLEAVRRLRQNPLEAENLIGLGQGLTPAGDDMLVGFLAVVNHSSGNRAFARRLRGAVSGALRKTADISAQALANALACDYHEYVQNCLRDVCEGEKEEVYISASSLINMGASSGSDIACGMYYGMLDMQR